MYNWSRIIIAIHIAFIPYSCSLSQPQNINSNWINFTKSNSGLLDNYIQDIEVDTANKVWIASGNTYGGFFLKRTDGRLTMYDGEWHYYENPYLDNSRYFYENLFIAKNGDKWMGKNGGDLEHTSSFYRFSAQKTWSAFNADDNTLDIVHFTNLNDSTVIIKHNAGIGTLLVGYNNFRLVYGVTYKTNQDILDYEDLNFQDNKMDIIRSAKYPTTALITINDSTILGYTFNGVSYFQFVNGKLKHLKNYELPLNHMGSKNSGGEYDNNIWVDKESNIWVGYASGFYKFKEDTFEEFTEPDSLKWTGIIDLKFDKNNTAWFVTHHSFISFDGEKWKEIFINGNREIDWFTCLEIDHTGNIWIGTRDQGIFVYNPAGLSLQGHEHE